MQTVVSTVCFRMLYESGNTVKNAVLRVWSDYSPCWRGSGQGYSNRYDRAHGRTGSAIMVHGGCRSGVCFAMSDPAIEEIYGLAWEDLRGGQDFSVCTSFLFA